MKVVSVTAIFFTPINRVLFVIKLDWQNMFGKLYKVTIFRLNSYIHNNWALLPSSCLKTSVTKSVYKWLACHMCHTHTVPLTVGNHQFTFLIG